MRTETNIMLNLIGVFALAIAILLPSKAFSSDPALLCREQTARFERNEAIPHKLLEAISIVESGRWDPARKAGFAWPWTVTAEGQGQFLPTKAEAIAEVRRLKARGVKNIDVGCMQVNLHHHAGAFPDLETAFDPVANVAYAAGFLKRLFAEQGSWPMAAASYHSRNEAFAIPYKAKVMTAWAEQKRQPSSLLPASLPVAKETPKPGGLTQTNFAAKAEAIATKMRAKLDADRETAREAAASYRAARLAEFKEKRRNRG